MQLYYSDNIINGKIILSEDEAHHCLTVLRKRRGDVIEVVDGKGGWYKTIIENENIKECNLKIISQKNNYGKTNHHIHIAIAPTKSHDRLEWFIEKTVEIGIQEITFLNADNSHRKDVKMSRINKVALSAMKQSFKAYLPHFNPIVPINDFISKANMANKYIGCFAEDRSLLQKIVPANQEYCVIIGPEGDFSLDEIDFAKEYGFQTISLGSSRLRTETAGIVACHTLNILNEVI